MMPSWRPPTLHTARLTLRGLTEEDAEAIFAYAANPNMTHYTLWEPHQTLADSLRFVRDYALARYREGVPEPMGMVDREDPSGQVIGCVGGFWVSQANATMELGYALSEDHWGKGLVVEAATVLIDYLFTAYSVERLQARSVAENQQSLRVLDKLGLSYEGTLRSALWRRGRFRDVCYFSILRGEWEAQHRLR